MNSQQVTQELEVVPMNIYQKVMAVASKVDYVKRGSAGQGTGVLYDEVLAKARQYTIEYGIIIKPNKVGEARARSTTKENYVYECDFEVQYINADNPEDFFVHLVEAHAMDSGDKAPGKAITYATKTSMVKIFQIETGINDESRVEHLKPVTKSQAEQIRKALGNDEERIQRFCAHYELESVEQVPQKAFKEAMAAIRKSNEKGEQQ